MEDHPGAVEYGWFLDGPQIDKGPDLLTVDVDFPAPGEYQLCVDVDNKPCILISENPEELCKTITITDGEADAGDITADTSPSCPNTEISFSVANYTDTDDFDQWLFLTDATGEILYAVQSDAGAYTNTVCDTYTVYSYNFYNAAETPYVLPVLGDNVNDFSADCMACFCDLESLEITWEDTEMPTFTNPPGDITVDCYDEVAIIPDLDYTDNCLPDGTVVGIDMGSSDACAGGSYTRTWTVTDLCGNETTHIQTITVDPAPVPVFTNIPDNMNLSCADLADGEVSVDYTNSSVGACLLEGSVIGVGDVAPDICGGDVTYTWTTQDACGNDVVAVQLVTIDPPLDVEFMNVPADVTITCAQLPFTPVDLMYTNSDIGGCLIEGTEDTPEIVGDLLVCTDQITITWEVTDFCGRVFDTMQVVTLEDTNPPTFDAPPADIAYDCYLDVPAAEDLAWTDNCDGNGIVPIMTEVDNADQCGGGTITRTWEYIDDCGLPVSHTQTLTINPPAAVDWTSTLPQDIDVECGEALPPLDPLDYSNGTGDSCDDSGTRDGSESGALLLCGDQVIRTWDYTPVCGAPITHTQTITLIDVTSPELQDEPADEVYDCYIDVPLMEDLTWIDNCDGTGIVSGVEAGTIDDCNGGIITRTWTYTDQCGTNTDTHIQTITVTPVPDIVWTSPLPMDMIIECIDDALPAPVDLDYSNAPISANCLDEGTESPVDTGVFVNCGDQIMRTWTATGDCGEVITHVQTFTFDDTEAPEFTSPPADLTFDCYLDVPIMEDLEWTDNCEGSGTVSGMESGTIDDCEGGTIMRTWTYTDLCNNTVIHIQTITVTAVPDIVWITSLPIDITIECIDDALPAPVDLDYSNAPISANCLDEGTVSPLDTGVFVNCGDQIMRTWTATGDCGEVITHVQTFTFDDTEAPVFTSPPADLTFDCYLDVPIMEDLDWTDNCEGPGTVSGMESGTIDDCEGGTIMRTWTYSDLCNNTVTHTQTITVTAVPDIVWTTALPADVTIECLTDPLPDLMDLDYSNAPISDTCLDEGAAPPTDEGAFVSCGDQITRTWTATAVCGEVLTHVQTFTFQDLTPPVFVNTPDAAITIDCLTELPPFDDLEWSDNCDGTGFAAGVETGGPLDPCTGGSITRTWMHTDFCGNGPIAFNQIITLTPPIETTCDDGDDCTINDVHTLDCEGNVCIPCMGIITDCTGVIAIEACDDGDDCTINDVLERACDDTICVPCMGEVTDCTNGLTFNEPCSDGDPCTINDFRVIDCQDQECVPCMGTPNPTPDPTIIAPSLSCSNETTTLEVNDCTGQVIWYDDAAGTNVVFVGTPFVTPILTADITYYAACDVNGCLSNLISVDLTIIDAQTTTITGDDIICLGDFSTLDAGAGFIGYDWGGGNTDQTLSAALTGTYTVTVTDVNGCTSTDEFGLQVITPSLPDISGSLTFCLDGFTTLSGDPGLQYLWLPNSETTQDITVSSPGNYSLIVTDSNGCTSSNTVSVTESTELEPIINGGPVFCADEDVQISVGAGFSTYIWSPNGENGSDITVNTAGTYSVTVTDASGCTGSSTLMITESNLPGPEITGDLLFCPGSDAELEVSSVDFSDFDWSTGSTNSFIVVDEADTYSVTVTDANGCIQSTSITIAEDIGPEPIINGDLFICEGEESTLSSDGLYQIYSWSTGDQGPNADDITVNTSGTYTLTVFDFNGCSGSSSVNVVSVSDIELFIEGGTSFCEGGSTQLDAGDFESYQWTPNGENTQQITASTGGDYTVVVTDVNGCTASSTVTVQEDTELSPTISGDDTVCESGSTTLSVLGNFTSTVWSTSETTPSITAIDGDYQVTVTDATGCTGSSLISITTLTPDQVTIAGELELCEGQLIDLEAIGDFGTYAWSNSQTTQSISVNASGDYSVTATDTNGCTSSTSVTLTVNTLNPPVISGEIDLCQGDTETLSVDTYNEYLWSTAETSQQINITAGGTYIVTVTDVNGCTGSTAVSITEQPLPSVTILGSRTFCPGGFTTLSVNGTFSTVLWTPSNMMGNTIDVNTEGTVTVTVTDANGCSNTATVEIEEQLNLSPEIGGDLEICEGASGVLTVGTFATYDWSTGEDTNEITINAGGTYRVTVYDQSGCSGSSDVLVSEVESFNIEIGGPDYYCESLGSTTISAPTGFDNYLWSTGLNTPDLIVTEVGDYAVTVTDDLGCTGSSQVTITQIPQATPMILGDPSFCIAGATTLSVDGVYAEYLWQDGSTNDTYMATEPSLISVTVTDDLGCTASSDINVGYYESAIAEISGSTAYCVGASTTLGAGDAASWIWSTNETTQAISVDTEGDYAVTITDVNGCTASSQVTVTEEEFLSPSIVGDKEFCFGGSTTLDAGSAFSNWVWSTGDVTQTLDVSSPGLYSVTVSDESGCTGTNEVLVSSLLQPEPIISGQDQLCRDGDVTLSVNADYSLYAWSTNDITPDITVATPGEYSVTITDESGCTASSEYSVTQADSPAADITVECSDDELTYTITVVSDADLIDAGPYVGAPTVDGFTVSDIPVADMTTLVLISTVTTCDTTLMVAPPNCACSAIADAGLPGLINCDIPTFTLGGSMTSSGSIYSYEWTDQDGVVVSNDPTFDTSVGGTFTLEVTDVLNVCSVTSTVIVDDETNEPLAIISAAPDNVIDCVIDVVTLSTGVQQDVIYTWMTGKETIEALEVVVTEGGEVTLIAVDTITGCNNSETIFIADQEEYPLLLILEPELLTCANGSVLLDASTSQSSGTIEYQWSDDGGDIAGATDLTLEVLEPGTYYLEAIDINNNCQNVDTIEVLSLENYPTINAGDDITLPCEDPESSLIVTIENNGQETVTLWTTDDGNILTNPNQTEVSVSLAGQYYVQVSDVLTGCSVSDTLIVSPNGGPSEVQSFVTDPVCDDIDGGEIQLTVLSGGNPPYLYTVDGMENSTGLFTNLTGGSYLVEVVDAQGCGYLTTIEVEEASEVQLSFEEPEITLDLGESATLTLITNLEQSEIVDITWSPELPVDCPLCLEVQLDEIQSTITYTATIINAEGCEASAMVTLQILREDDIFVPNIVLIGQEDDTFYPQSGSLDVITDQMNIYDRWGNIIYTNTNFPTNTPEFGWDGTFNGQRVEAGVYVYLFIFDVPGLGKITKAGDLTVIF